MTAERLHRLVMALGLCEEFGHKVSLQENGQIVAFLHQKWLQPLEDRLRGYGWHYMTVRSASCFRIIRAVDMYR